MIFTDEKNNSYYSLYLFEDYDTDTGELERTLHRNAELIKFGDDMYMIK
jgi:hypothetical protein